MANYCTKADLYARAARIRKELGLSPASVITDSTAILSRSPSLKIDSVPFETAALHGLCSFGDSSKADVILLNANRSPIEQNFDCMHEYVHLHEHRNERRESFCCYDRVTEKQDAYLEWQANEGAAEILVPYTDFIPRFFIYLEAAQAGFYRNSVQSDLAEHYFVSEAVIENRIRSLSYELDQYKNGTAIDDLDILSHNQQQRWGIQPSNYVALCDFLSISA